MNCVKTGMHKAAIRRTPTGGLWSLQDVPFEFIHKVFVPVIIMIDEHCSLIKLFYDFYVLKPSHRN